MKKDLALTFITQFFIMVLGIVVFKFAYSFLGGDGFSEYALSRKTLSLLEEITCLGLAVGIPRYIAYEAAGESHKEKNPDMYFLSGFIIILISTLIATLVLNMFKGPISFLLFGSSNYDYLVLPVNIALIGLMFHELCYCYFRGYMRMTRANILQFVNLGCVPILAIMIGKDTVQVITITGLAWLFISAFPLFFILRYIKYSGDLYSYMRELLTYGLRRLPGDVTLTALFTLPATFVAHIADLTLAGYVAFGISLLTMASAFFGPIGLVLLPKMSQLLATKNRKLLKIYIYKLLKLTSLSIFIGITFFEIFANQIISTYIGEGSSDIVLISRIVLIGGYSYPFYTETRSIIDAYYVRGINSTNVLISFSIFLLFSGATYLLGGNYINILIAFVLSVFLLGGLSLIRIKKIIAENE